MGDLVERLERPTNIPLVPALSQISEIAHELVAQQYQILNSDLLPQLRAAGIRILPRDEWTAEQIQFLKIYFSGVVLPVLSPIGLDPAHPFPRILNKSLNFIVKLNGKDAFGRNSGRAIVQVPRSLPHIIELPDELASSGREFVFVSSIIHLFMAEIFVGQTTLLRSLGHRQLPP